MLFASESTLFPFEPDDWDLDLELLPPRRIEGDDMFNIRTSRVLKFSSKLRTYPKLALLALSGFCKPQNRGNKIQSSCFRLLKVHG